LGQEPKNVAPLNKVKFDRQIVAIAKTQGATAVYSDDGQVASFAIECGMEAYKLSDIVNPPKQERLPGIDDNEAEPKKAEGEEAGKE
jgi:hypothetical protein